MTLVFATVLEDCVVLVADGRDHFPFAPGTPSVDDARMIHRVGDALSDDESLVRGHSACALGRIGGIAAQEALLRRFFVEEEEWVREELAHALDGETAQASPSKSSSLGTPGAESR